MEIQDGNLTQRERKVSGQPQRGANRPVAAPPAPRSASDILAAAKARAEARRQRAQQTADESVVQLIIALIEMRDSLQGEHAELDRNRTLYPGAARQLAEIEIELGQVKADLDFYLNPKQEEEEDEASFEGRKHQMLLSVEEARRMVTLRDAARGWTEAIRAVASPDARTITSFLEDSSEGNIGPFVADVPKGSPNHVTTWKGRHLGSSNPDDEVVSEVPKAFGEMVEKFTTRKEKEDDDVIQLLDYSGYFISNEEVDAIRKSGDSANLTLFLGSGKSRYSVMGYRFGESLVWERRPDGKVYPLKASGAKVGRMAFLFRDRNKNGALTAVERNRLRAIEHDGTNVSKVWHDDLREALEFQLRREAENAERHEASQEVRNMSGLQDPITSYDLVMGKAGTCIMDYGLRREDRFMKVPPYRLVSDGVGVFVSEHTPGALDRASWLKRVLDPNKRFPISELRKLHEWKEASRANGHTEARWQTELKTKELDATAINRTNLNGLVSIESGVDGVYTFTTQVRRRGTAPKPYFVPGGFAVERKGSTVKFVWATPNMQAEAKRMGGDKTEEIVSLPPTFRNVFRSLYLGINNLRGENAWKQSPAHLQMEVRDDDKQEETEETSS